MSAGEAEAPGAQRVGLGARELTPDSGAARGRRLNREARGLLQIVVLPTAPPPISAGCLGSQERLHPGPLAAETLLGLSWC